MRKRGRKRYALSHGRGLLSSTAWLRVPLVVILGLGVSPGVSPVPVPVRATYVLRVATVLHSLWDCCQRQRHELLPNIDPALMLYY